MDLEPHIRFIIDRPSNYNMQAVSETTLDGTFVYSNLLSYLEGWYALKNIEDYTDAIPTVDFTSTALVSMVESLQQTWEIVEIFDGDQAIQLESFRHFSPNGITINFLK
jgi:hypothetical protein